MVSLLRTNSKRDLDEPPIYECGEDVTQGNVGTGTDGNDSVASYKSKRKAIVVTLERKEANGVIRTRPGQLATGKLISTRDELVFLSSDIGFEDMNKLLTQRMIERNDVNPDKLKIYWGMRLSAERGPVYVSRSSWEAAREFLLTKDEAALSFVLVAVERDYEDKKRAAEAKKKTAKCVVQ